jgi:hypothetical protein
MPHYVHIAWGLSFLATFFVRGAQGIYKNGDKNERQKGKPRVGLIIQRVEGLQGPG